MRDFLERFKIWHIIYELFRAYLDQKEGKPINISLSKDICNEFDKIGISETNLYEKVEEFTNKFLEV